MLRHAPHRHAFSTLCRLSGVTFVLNPDTLAPTKTASSFSVGPMRHWTSPWADQCVPSGASCDVSASTPVAGHWSRSRWQIARRGLRCRPRLHGVRDERKPWIGGKLEALVRQGDVADQWVVHPLGPRPVEAHIVARPRDAAPHQISLVVSNGNDGVLGYTLESARG